MLLKEFSYRSPIVQWSGTICVILVQWSGTICVILVEGSMRNKSVELF